MNNKQKHSFISNRKLAILTILSFFMFMHSTAYTQKMQVKIAVLALRGVEESVKRWTPTAEYLSAQIPEYTFVIAPLDFEEIYEAVENSEVDFVLTNSGIYVELEYLYGIDRIATLQDLWQDQAYTQFGGVIFTYKNRKDINNLDDLKNKSLMAVYETSLGGWRMAQREFKDYGIDLYSDITDLQFTGTHDKVVYAVQKGLVDVGIIRTGILEKMNEEGKINIKDFTILNQQHPDNFSLLLSTRLYPEWPFSKVKDTPDQLAQQVSIALLNMLSNNRAAKGAGIAGWTIPHHYQLVHDCFKELRVGPYEDLGKITLGNLIQQYWYWILVGIIGTISLVIITIYVLRLNRKLKISTIELKESRNILEKRIKEKTANLKQANVNLRAENEQRKQVENHIRHLQNVLMSIRNVNQLIVNEKNQKKLLQRACEILKKTRDYKLVWIGLIEEDTKNILPIGQAGFEEGYLKSTKITWDDSETGKGPTGTAIKTKKPSVMRDISADSRYKPWREEAIKRGYASSVSVPLIYEERIFGALNVYATIPDAFDEEEIDLLLEVSQDIAFALHTIKIEQEIESTKEFLQNVIDNTSDLVCTVDLEGNFLSINKAVIEHMGYEEKELIGKPKTKLAVKPELFISTFKEVLKKGSISNLELPFRRKDGTIADILYSVTLLKDKSGHPVAVAGFGKDITERKQTEEELKKHREHLEELVKERTTELKEKYAELERYNRLFEGREFRIKELKDKVKELEKKSQ